MNVNSFFIFSLRMFRTFNPFRILVCGGDGSVSWVLTEIDKLNMHNQVIESVFLLSFFYLLSVRNSFFHQLKFITIVDDYFTKYF